MRTEIHVFADLSGSGLDAPALGDLTRRWASPDSLGSVACDLNLVVPRGLERSAPSGLPHDWRWLGAAPVAACEQAFDRAVARQTALLLLLQPLWPSRDAVGALLAALDRDPLMTFVHARIAEPERGLLLPLDRSSAAQAALLPRRVLAELPEFYVAADLVTPCFVAHPSTLELGLERSNSLLGALANYVTRARRAGMRSLVANRAVVSLAPGRGSYPSAMVLDASPRERERLSAAYPECSQVQRERAVVHEREQLLARATSGPRSLLVDARNMSPTFNGTTQVALGFLRGLRALDAAWEIEVWTNPEAARCHALPERFAPWALRTAPPDRGYSVGLRLSQPWDMSEVIDLHRFALCNVYWMLDTIAWDVVYAAPPGLDGLWRFVSAHADGLAFISDYSLARHAQRFQRPEPPPRIAAPLSCDPSDYVDARAAADPMDGDYVFVVGNNLDHKDMVRTVDLLRHGFPRLRLRALGLETSPSERVTAQPSGQVDDLEVQCLYAGARAVVFPSFYEGFGFPVVNGLSYGKTVLARRSALLEEVAAHYRGPGRLAPYRSDAELVRSLAAVLHGSPPPSLPLGSALPPEGPTHDWRCTAREIMGLCARLLHDPTSHRWRVRDDALAQISTPR
jgi:glycosyltransferase involved in cell wall biosynthesis